MIYGLAMPYMGSKRKLAPKIIKEIKTRTPNATTFYDLFFEGFGGHCYGCAFEAHNCAGAPCGRYIRKDKRVGRWVAA